MRIYSDIQNYLGRDINFASNQAKGKGYTHLLFNGKIYPIF